MGRDHEENVAEDGGWGEMIDHGHDLAEYMLDTVHPYDLHGHKPADRWGTRQELVSKRFADVGSLADEGRLSTDRRIVSSGRARPPRKSSPDGTRSRPQTPSAPKPVVAAAKSLEARKRLGAAPFKDSPKGRQAAARAARAARNLGLDADDVGAVVSCGLPSKRVAELLGLPLKQIKEIHRAYADAASPTGSGTSAKVQGRPATSARSKRTVATDKQRPSLLNPLAGGPVVQRPRSVPSIPGCASCGAPIGFNGRCQCS